MIIRMNMWAEGYGEVLHKGEDSKRDIGREFVVFGEFAGLLMSMKNRLLANPRPE